MSSGVRVAQEPQKVSKMTSLATHAQSWGLRMTHLFGVKLQPVLLLRMLKNAHDAATIRYGATTV